MALLFKKFFKGVRKGDKYPVDFNVGAECPEELEDEARAAGVLDEEGETEPAQRTSKKAPKKTTKKGPAKKGEW